MRAFSFGPARRHCPLHRSSVPRSVIGRTDVLDRWPAGGERRRRSIRRTPRTGSTTRRAPRGLRATIAASTHEVAHASPRTRHCHRRRPPRGLAHGRRRQCGPQRARVPGAVQGTRGDQHHALDGRLHARRRSHARAPRGGRPAGGRHADPRAGRPPQGRRAGRPAARPRSVAEAVAAARAHRRGGSQARGLGARSVHADRGERLVLRARRRPTTRRWRRCSPTRWCA